MSRNRKRCAQSSSSRNTQVADSCSGLPTKIYKIQLSPASKRNLKGLDPHIGKKIFDDIKKLAADPRPKGYEQLSDKGKVYRCEVGPKKNYRVVYQIQDDQLLVLVLKVADRKDVYR